jgi:rRNA maturation RNase YbeY
MKLFINQKPTEIDEENLNELIESILTEYDKEGKEVSITYVDNEEIRKINLAYLNRDEYTDVISFNLEDEFDDTLLGDIYVSYEQAMIQAREYDVTVENELIRLTVHGILHALGYEDDTPEKREVMEKEENRWLGVYFA